MLQSMGSQRVGHDWEKAMAPHSSTLAWQIPWMEEPGRLQSMGSLRVGHDWATSLSLFTFMHWRRKWQPTPVFLPGESQGRGSLVGCRLWVTQSPTPLKRRSSSSSRETEHQMSKIVASFSHGHFSSSLFPTLYGYPLTSLTCHSGYFQLLPPSYCAWAIKTI